MLAPHAARPLERAAACCRTGVRNGYSLATTSNAAIGAKNERGPQSEKMQAKYCVRSNCHETQQQRDETCIFSRRCEKCGLGELAFGVESCPDPAERALRAASLRQIESRPTLAITRHSAAAFGVLAAAVKQAGRSPRPRYNDLWIAAQTIEHGYALLTLNTADFSGLPGLRLLTLRGLGK